jgi:hypothetical protein
MKPLKVILVCLLFFTVHCYAQQIGGYEPKAWGLMEFSGGLGVQGMFGKQTNRNDLGLLNKVEQSAFSGLANFRSKSYIWHPYFVELTIGASYKPSVEKFAQIVTSTDRTTSLNSKALNISALFLKEKKVTFSTRVNVSESYSNIENIANSKTNNKNFGGSLRYRNNFAPINMGYDIFKTKTDYSNTDRVLQQTGSAFQLYTSKDWKWFFATNLDIIHRRDKNSFFNDNEYITESDRISLTNNINFTKNKRNVLLSRIDYFNQKTNGNFKRLNFLETLNITFSDEFRWEVTSNYLINGFRDTDSKQFMVNSILTYELYKSLFTRASVSHSNTKSSFIKQTQNGYGISTRYTKKIPLDGRLILNYSYDKRINDTNGLSSQIEIINEEYTLSDSEVVLLANPNIFTNTIVIKNNTGTLIYNENIDYVVYEVGDFIEIQRLPGGLITNNSNVLISYTSNQNGDYTINSNSNNFSAGINLFKGVFNFNYNYSNQSFDDTSNINYELENYFKRTGYNGSINYKFFQGNIRYEKMNSALVPYKQFSYNLNLHGNYRQHMLYSLDYRAEDYSIIQEAGRTEKREYLTGMLAYTFNRNNKLNFMLGYNKRTVNKSGRNWLSGRISYIKSIGNLNFLADINFYNSTSNSSEINFIGGNVSIIRNF